MIWVILACSLLLNAWLGYREYSREARNRQALAYPAEIVAYRLTQLSRFAGSVSDSEWADIKTRTWISDSIQAIIDQGAVAERIPTRGQSAQVARKLGELARRLVPYRDAAQQLTLEPTGNSTQARARIQELAGRAAAAGWGPPEGAGRPAGWTYGRDWAELNRALDQLLVGL